MYTVFVFGLLLIATPTVFAQSDDQLVCSLEFLSIVQRAQACNPGHGYSLFQIQPTFARVAAGEVSKYQLSRYIQNTCRTAFNDTQCIRNLHASPQCQDQPTIQLFINFITIMTTQVEYMCSVAPGQSNVRYLDWVTSDGPSCSASNLIVNSCIKTGQERLGLSDDNNSLTANICTMIQIQNECSHLYRQCKNKKVFQYMLEFSQILTELYNC